MEERLRAEGTALQARAATVHELQLRLDEAEAGSAAAAAAAATDAAAAGVPTHELAEKALAARAAERGVAGWAHETTVQAAAAHELGVARRDAGELRREAAVAAELVAALRRVPTAPTLT